MTSKPFSNDNPALDHQSVCLFFSDSVVFDKVSTAIRKGAQWLSGRVLDSRPKGRGFKPHRRHCVVVLEQDTFILA